MDRPIQAFDFYQALRLIERHLYPDISPDAPERIQLRQLKLGVSPSLGFPRAELAGLHTLDPLEPGDPSLSLTTHFLGLVGARSPLPIAYAQEILEQLEESPQMLDFLDIFHHRLLTLLFRGWMQTRQLFSHREDGTDALTRAMLALLDLDPDDVLERTGLTVQELLPFCGILLEPTRPASGLESILGTLLELPVRVIPGATCWVDVPSSERLRLTRGTGRRTLSGDALLGRRVRDAICLLELEFGPVPRNRIADLEPEGRDFKRTISLSRFYVRRPVRVRICLRVQACELPRIRLGRSGGRALRRTAVLLNPRGEEQRIRFEAIGVP